MNLARPPSLDCFCLSICHSLDDLKTVHFGHRVSPHSCGVSPKPTVCPCMAHFSRVNLSSFRVHAEVNLCLFVYSVLDGYLVSE